MTREFKEDLSVKMQIRPRCGGYCAHRFGVEFNQRFAELVTTAQEPDKVLPFVKKD